MGLAATQLAKSTVDVNLSTHLHLDLNCNQATSAGNTQSTSPGNNLQIKVI